MGTDRLGNNDVNTKVAEPVAPGQPKKKLSRGKKLMIVGVAVVVVAVAALGFNVWHNTPGFCNNPVCHEVMDPYVETYSQAEGQEGVDKWGNTVANTCSLLAVSHASQGVACLDCHLSDMGQQISEVQETLTGAYVLPLFEVSGVELLANSNHESASGTGDEFCMNDACHSNISRDTLRQATADRTFNPHMWFHGSEQCTDCHKSHRASVMVCTECHVEAADELPDGWVDAREGTRIRQQM